MAIYIGRERYLGWDIPEDYPDTPAFWIPILISVEDEWPYSVNVMKPWSRTQ
jgi:hypothetical protein